MSGALQRIKQISLFAGKNRAHSLSIVFVQMLYPAPVLVFM